MNKKRILLLIAAVLIAMPFGAGIADAGKPTTENPNNTGPEGKPCNADHGHPQKGLENNKKCQETPDPCADKGGDTDDDGICDDDEECPENVDDPDNESCPTDPCADKGGDTDDDGICDDDEACPENVNDPTNSSCPGGDLTCRARVISADAGNDGADLSVIESNEPKDPCADDADGLAPATLPLPARILSTETGADGSASSRVLDAGGGEGDPGRVSILGADANCDGTSDAWILLIQDGEGGDVLRLDSDTLPDLSPDGSSGIFWTSEEDGHAQAILITGDPGSLRVVEAEACDA